MNKIPNPVTNGAMALKLRMFFWAVGNGAMNAPRNWNLLQGYLTPAIPTAGRFLLRNTPRFYYSYGAVIVAFTVGKCVPDGQQLYEELLLNEGRGGFR
jgi:hypothetical protein